jgi:hypothetical protein
LASFRKFLFSQVLTKFDFYLYFNFCLLIKKLKGQVEEGYITAGTSFNKNDFAKYYRHAPGNPVK